MGLEMSILYVKGAAFGVVRRFVSDYVRCLV